MRQPTTDIKLFISSEQLLEIAKEHLTGCGIDLDLCSTHKLGTYFSATHVAPSFDDDGGTDEGRIKALEEGCSLSGVGVNISVAPKESE